MTPEMALAIALSCKTLPPDLAPIMVGIAQNENPSLDPRAVNHNANGTDDFGLAQVNTINLRWTGLKDPFDPCANLTAAARVLFAKYNGNPPDRIKALYSAGVMTRLANRNNKEGEIKKGDHTEGGANGSPPSPPVIYVRPAWSGRNLVYSK